MWYFVNEFFVAFGEGHFGVRNVRQQRRLGARRSAGLRGKVRRNVGDILGAELGRNRIHDGRRTRRTRLLARAVLERLQLRLEVARPLRREIGNGVAHAYLFAPWHAAHTVLANCFPASRSAACADCARPKIRANFNAFMCVVSLSYRDEIARRPNISVVNSRLAEFKTVRKPPCMNEAKPDCLARHVSVMSAMGHVWTAPTGQGILLAFCLRSGASHVSGLFARRS